MNACMILKKLCSICTANKGETLQVSSCSVI